MYDLRNLPLRSTLAESSWIHSRSRPKPGVAAADERLGRLDLGEWIRTIRAVASAFGLGEYAEALRLGRAGYEAFSESNHRWGLITALCRIGFAALALGEPIEAAGNFRTALERAHTSEAISLELLALSGIGAALAETGKHEQAAPMLIFALGHEQLPPAYDYARPALRALEAELSPEDLAAARDAAAHATLAELVQHALAAAPALTAAAST